jgi:hypothetical protein
MEIRGRMRRKEVSVAPGEEERSATDRCQSRFSGASTGASDTGESPWRQLRERAEKILGDKKHDPNWQDSVIE